MKLSLRPSVSDLKAAIAGERDRRAGAHVSFQSHAFQADAGSQDRIARAALAGDDTLWIAADNTLVALTADDVRELLRTITERNTALALAARRLKDQVDAGGLPDPTDNANWQ
jgi:hypothetical protein